MFIWEVRRLRARCQRGRLFRLRGIEARAWLTSDNRYYVKFIGDNILDIPVYGRLRWGRRDRPKLRWADYYPNQFIVPYVRGHSRECRKFHSFESFRECFV